MNDPIVRHLQLNDLEGLLELYANHLFEEGDLPPPDAESLRAVWAEICANPRIRYFGVIVDDKPVSSCNVTIVPNLTRGASPFGLIENVVTHREYRGRGLATAVLKETLAYAWRHRCYKVMLLSSSRRFFAHGLYEKVGFSKEQKIGYVIEAPPRG